MMSICVGKEGVPDTDEFDVDIDGECLLECRGLRPSQIVIASKHLVRKVDLLMVAWRQQPDLYRTLS